MNEFSARDYNECKSKYPLGSKKCYYVTEMLSNLETAGVLVSHGRSTRSRYLDASGISFIWEQIGP